MAEYNVILGSKGQLTLPKKVREQFSCRQVARLSPLWMKA